MVKLPTLECKRCGYVWIPRVPSPVTCAKCRSPYWNKAKRSKGGEK